MPVRRLLHRLRPFRNAVLGFAVAGALAAAALPAAAAGVFFPKTFTLANGLQVVLIENHRIPAVVQMVWYKVGSADEVPGKSGIAHFLEHLMFKGTRSVPAGEFSHLIASNGGRDNAFTTADYTAYFEIVAADRLPLVMRLESDRMANLAIPPDSVASELQVVLEERRMRIGNRPEAELGVAMSAAQFLNVPYGRPTIGWTQEVQGLGRDDALAFYRSWYAPNNAILVVEGDVTLEQLRDLAETYYGPIPSRPAPKRVTLREPEPHAARRVSLESEQVREPSWRRSYLAPSYGTASGAEPYALQVLADLLGGGTTGRLYRELVLKQGLATAAAAWYDPDQRSETTFGIQVTPRAPHSLADAETAVDAELARLLKSGVSEEEVAASRKRLQAAAVFARDSLQTGARVIGEALAIGRTIEDVESWPDRIGAVTPAAVMAAARDVLEIRRSVTGTLEPPKDVPAKQSKEDRRS